MTPQERNLIRLLQNSFRGCHPRIRRTQPVRGYDFALQLRVTGPRTFFQLTRFQRFIAQKYEQARLLITFQGTITEQPVELNMLVQAAITGDQDA